MSGTRRRELCDEGSVRNYLDSGGVFDRGVQASLLEAVANGMDHLHTRQPTPLLHGDLRAANVLLKRVGGALVPCVAMAGVLRWKARAATTDPVRLHRVQDGREFTLPFMPCAGAWQAPERWSMHCPDPTAATDVFAFGMLIYEVCLCVEPS